VSWVLVLAAPEASYLTGQTLSVNGDRLMVWFQSSRRGVIRIGHWRSNMRGKRFATLASLLLGLACVDPSAATAAVLR